MIIVDVRDMRNPNIDQLELEFSGSRVKCSELEERCKMMLNLSDSEKKYAIRLNQVFVYPTQYIDDGETVSFAEMPDTDDSDDAE